MNFSKIKLCIILTVIGFILLAVNIDLETPLSYPSAYKNTTQVIGEYQYYNINTFYGASDTTYKRYDPSGDVAEDNVTLASVYAGEYSTTAWFVDQVYINNFQIDIASDILGFILLIYCCLNLKKYSSKMFTMALIASVTSLILKLMLMALPFIFNGLVLCNLALGIGIAYLFAQMFTTFFILKGYLSLMQDSCCRDERKWLNTTWMIYFIICALMLILRWLDLSIMHIIFEVAATLICLLMGYLFKRTAEFILRNCKINSAE